MSIQLTDMSLRERVRLANEGFNASVDLDAIEVPELASPGWTTAAEGTFVAAPILGGIAAAISVTLAVVGILGAVAATAISTAGVGLVIFGLFAAIYALSRVPEKEKKHNEMAALKNNYRIMEEDLEEKYSIADEAEKANRSYFRQFFEYMLTYC